MDLPDIHSGNESITVPIESTHNVKVVVIGFVSFVDSPEIPRGYVHNEVEGNLVMMEEFPLKRGGGDRSSNRDGTDSGEYQQLTRRRSGDQLVRRDVMELPSTAWI